MANENGKDRRKNEAFAEVLGARPSGRAGRAGAPARDHEGGPLRMKHIGGQFEEPVARQLKVIAAEEGRSVIDLLAEGINLVFERRGRPPIARRRN